MIDMTNATPARDLRDPEWPRHNAETLAQPWATESIHESFEDVERALSDVRETLQHVELGPYDTYLRPRIEEVYRLAVVLLPDVTTAHLGYEMTHPRLPWWWRLLRRLHDGA